jgi:colanic acid biosynthesis glycosyl transferase WcaI
MCGVSSTKFISTTLIVGSKKPSGDDGIIGTKTFMRIVVHDYGNFPYPWQLAKAFAKRGHTVLYIYNTAEPARTTLDIESDEQDRLQVVGITLSKPLLKRSFVARRQYEIDHGVAVEPHLDQFKPDVVISANTPLDAQAHILKRAKKLNARFIYWVQDLISVAAYAILKQRLSLFGAAVGKYYMWMEKTLLRQSDDVVLITEDFRQFTDQWGVSRDKTQVIENWAPIAKLPTLPRHNDWAKQHGTEGKLCLLYAGTLGMKHNPALLIQMAARLKPRADVKIIVAGEGSGMPHLRQMKEEMHLDNLEIIPFQPFDVLPQALAAADVLIAILEPEGSKYCVPSKVLTYLCSGRALLLAVTPENLIARIVSQNRAGLVVPPTDSESFVDAAEKLLTDDKLRQEYGRNARQYAERHFDIETITDRFELLFTNPLERHSELTPQPNATDEKSNSARS